MLDILDKLIPAAYQLNLKTSIHYLKTIPDYKVLSVKCPDLSLYEIQIQKTLLGLVVIKHENYTSTSISYNWNSLTNILQQKFPKTLFEDVQEDLFINDLRF